MEMSAMVILQILISLIMPAIMIVSGRIIRSKIDSYMAPGLAYKTRSAELTPESWQYANRFFGTMMVAIGINMAVISTVFILAAVLGAGVNGWALALFFMCFEIVGIALPVFMTELMLGRLFDAEGKPLASGFDEEFEEEAEDRDASED